MRVAGFTEFGDPDVVRTMEIPKPEAGPGEVVVRVVATTVNPTDTLMRAGLQAQMMKGVAPPYVGGVEFAGRVAAASEGAGPLAPGQAVMGIVDARQRRGAHAEYVCVPVESVAPLLPGADIVGAGAVPMNGLTAKMAIETLGLPPGSSLLVTGGAGAVGGYAIQLARHAGLAVVADGKEQDRDLLERLGATIVVPRGEAMAAAVRRNFPGGVDGLIDGALLGNLAAALVRDGGGSVSLRRSNPITDPRLRNEAVSVFGQPADSSALRWLAARLAEGVMTPRIAVQLPLSAAAEAHRRVERGSLRGRVVLLPEGAQPDQSV
jgi:NADPH:quinone reductase-like Zn-dependent oxidoreductase